MCCFSAHSERVRLSQEQASWVCQCDESVVQRLEQDFKVTLQQQSSLDQWAAWLDNVVNQVLKPFDGSTSFPRAARQFLLKWSFYRYKALLKTLFSNTKTTFLSLPFHQTS